MASTYQSPLPPSPASAADIANNQGATIQFLDDLAYEMYQIRQPFDVKADRGLNLYVGRHFKKAPPKGVTQYVINRLLNVVVAQVAVQSEQAPRLKLSAREIGDPPICYVNSAADLETPAALATLAQIHPTAWQTTAGVEGAPVYPRPLEAQEIAAIEQAIAVKAFPAEGLVKVNDATVAEAYQVVLDAKWQDAECDFYVAEALLNKTIVGTQFTTYNWNDDTQTPRLFNPSHLQVLVDGTCTHVRDSAAAMLYQWFSVEQAKAMFPEIAADIEQADHSRGQQRASGGRNTLRIPAVYKNTQFARDMVAFRHTWIRHQPFPMSIADAVDQEKVTEQTREMPVMDAMGDAVPPAVDDFGNMVAAPTQQQTFYVNDKGIETVPGDPNWPTEMGIREICDIAGKVIYDRRCVHADIPLCQQINIPVPYCPYGMGEPERLEDLQMAANSLWTDILNYFHYFGTPPIVYPRSVADRLPDLLTEGYSSPAGQHFVVPDDIVKDLKGKLSFLLDVPSLPTDVFKLAFGLLDLIDTEGGRTEAVRGTAKAGWSGELMSQLLEESKGMIGFKSKRTEFYIRDLAKLLLHSITTRMSPEDCAEICSKYPIYVWFAIAERRKKTSTDVTVEITSGSGQQKERAKRENLELWAGGRGPISATTLLESFGTDPKKEQDNKIKEAEAATAIQAQVPPVVGGAIPPTGQAA